MEGEGHDGIVYNNNVFQLSVYNYTKVFDKHPRCCLHTVVTIKSVSYYLLVLINEVKYGISIVLFASRKHTDLEQG